MKLVIGNKNYSSWSLRPWLLLEHFKVSFEEIRIPLDTPEFAEQIAQYSAAGKVPVLLDQGTEIWDSLAICEYINESQLDGAGWPSSSAARAQARSVSAEMHSSFMLVRSNMPMNCRAQRRINFSTETLAEIQYIDALWCRMRELYGGNEPWLFGQFSIADCMFAPVAARFQTYRPELSPQARDYVDSVLALPAMRRWFEAAKAETEILTREEVGEPA